MSCPCSSTLHLRFAGAAGSFPLLFGAREVEGWTFEVSIVVRLAFRLPMADKARGAGVGVGGVVDVGGVMMMVCMAVMDGEGEGEEEEEEEEEGKGEEGAEEARGKDL